jgi:hypothetical protein
MGGQEGRGLQQECGVVLNHGTRLVLLALDMSGVNQEATMRLIFIGIFIFSASIAVVDTVEAQGNAKTERGHVMQAPVGHRQPSQQAVEGEDQFADSDLGRVINEQNRVLDRALKGICRGC